ncbi:MAG: SRPBCC family protein [Bacteroidota bacterium]
MKKADQVNTINIVFENLEKQKIKQDADGKTAEIDIDRYVSKERFENERRVLFQNHPIIFGPVGQVKNQGDYFLHDASGIPILVVKGKDGQVRAFLNMCRHRGVRLIEQNEGTIKRNIVCPYHAWSYDTAGCLKGVFHPQGFEDVSPETHSLIQLDCWVRLGMIFVVPNPELKGKFDIDEWLIEVYKITEEFDFGEYVPYHFKTEQLPCNWKLIVDGALEGYHFKIAHARTIGKYFLDNLSVNTDNTFHSSIVFPKRAMKGLKDTPSSDWNLRKVANILIHIFPSTIILIEPDHIMAVTFCPLDESTTEIKSFMMLPTEPTTEKEKGYWDLNADIFWNAIQEDNEMAILQQKSFSKFNKTSMTVGSYEKLIVQFENLVDDIILNA